MLAEAAPGRTTRALVITGGSAYLAELLRPLVASLDDVPAGSPPPGAEYDLIVIDGAAEVLDDALVAALAEGGRLVTGLVERGVTRLATGCKVAGTLSLLPLAEIGMPVLAEFAAPRRWSFG
jgi:protein-L-isoaspartate(D-aspartate) O-methyltransferase